MPELNSEGLGLLRMSLSHPWKPFLKNSRDFEGSLLGEGRGAEAKDKRTRPSACPHAYRDMLPAATQKGASKIKLAAVRKKL